MPLPPSQNPKVPASRKWAAIRLIDLMARAAAFPLLPLLRRTPAPWGPSPRILLLRADGIGDFLMTTHLFPALRRAYPQARIDLLCNRWSKEIADLYAGEVDEILTLGADNARPKVLKALIARLRAGRYDIAVDLRGDFRYTLLCGLSGARHRFGFAYSGFDFLLTHVLPSAGMHQVEEVAAMGRALGTPLEAELRLPLTDDLRRFAEEYLGSASPQAPWVAMHLSVSRPAKAWPLERFAEVASTLMEEHGARILLLGGKDDRAQAEAFSAMLPRPARIAAGETSLAQTAALLERCRLFVGIDSGPAHLSAAVHCPTLVLFGATDPRIYRPWGAHCRVLKASRPCDRRCDQVRCAIPEDSCMKTLPAEAVRASALELLEQYPQPSAEREPLSCA
ncbi:MAG: glycosyltransferase family 9 protein [Armatimonadetes bacterium]|nr:glycosyltransferase family 9 protein [Armatimonadota bacterium]